MFSFLTAAALVATTFTSVVSAVPLERSVARRGTGNAKTVIYYGQGDSQQDISTFCSRDDVDIISIGFVNGFPSMTGNNGWPSWNFGNQCWAGYYSNTKMYTYCDAGGFSTQIAACQAAGKKILVSLGGEVDSTNPYTLQANDVGTLAQELWWIFGPPGQAGAPSDLPRPFGDAVVDGFDFDIEGSPSDAWATLANTLRSTMGSGGLLTASPQCVVPDSNLASTIQNAYFDYLFIQFYNTRKCSARAHLDHTYGQSENGGQPTDIGYNNWVTWLKANAAGGQVPQLFIGLPGSTGSTTDAPMFLSQTEAGQLLKDFYRDQYFGGVMLWEATSALNNGDYIAQMHSALSSCGAITTTTTTTTVSFSHVFNRLRTDDK